MSKNISKRRLKKHLREKAYQIVRILYGEDYSLQDISNILSWSPNRARIYQIIKSK